MEVDINDAQIKEKRTRHGRSNPPSPARIRDSCLTPIVAPKAPQVITAADAAQDEACVTGLRASAVTLRKIKDPVDCNVLEGNLEQAFTSLDCTDGRPA